MSGRDQSRPCDVTSAIRKKPISLRTLRRTVCTVDHICKERPNSTFSRRQNQSDHLIVGSLNGCVDAFKGIIELTVPRSTPEITGGSQPQILTRRGMRKIKNATRDRAHQVRVLLFCRSNPITASARARHDIHTHGSETARDPQCPATRVIQRQTASSRQDSRVNELRLMHAEVAFRTIRPLH